MRKPSAASRPATFAEWKRSTGSTDEQIVTALRAHGVEVRTSYICMLRSGERNAGFRVAEALCKVTGLPVEHFMSPDADRTRCRSAFASAAA